MQSKNKTTLVIGLGLIGGSAALDLRKAGLAGRVIGIDKDPEHGITALARGIVDELGDMDSLALADVVVLAVPVSVLTALAPVVLEAVPSHAVVIDLGSTKGPVCKAVAGHANRAQFVAAHPIAGTENSGPQAAFEGLFKGKTNIICEREKSSEHALTTAFEVFEALGMKNVFMQAAEHDKHVAYVSHLSHVSSFLLGHTVLDIEKDEKNIFDLAGSGFASTVRLAKSSPDMWGPIFEQNAEYLSQALLEYIMHLQKFQYHLMKKDTHALMQMMHEANRIREVLSGIDVKSET
jgi:prephenate dehydrogenase